MRNKNDDGVDGNSPIKQHKDGGVINISQTFKSPQDVDKQNMMTRIEKEIKIEIKSKKEM